MFDCPPRRNTFIVLLLSADTGAATRQSVMIVNTKHLEPDTYLIIDTFL
jgi:hypothetical protein